MASHCVPEGIWGWRSRKRGRPQLPKNLRKLIREMAHDNPTWGEERIADELKLKLGIRVSPRTVSKYLARKRPGGGGTDQRWATFVRNQAKAIVACDFFTSVTLTFRVLYLFVVTEIGSRRILHCNVTAHPTADWITEQFREVLDDVHPLNNPNAQLRALQLNGLGLEAVEARLDGLLDRGFDAAALLT